MRVKPRRRYNSPQRQARSNATRGAILAAADELFACEGFASVTMDGIAQRAGVSLATVYLYFGGKAAIVGALTDQIVAANDLSVEQVEQAPQPVIQLRIGARIIRQLNERSWHIADVLRSMHRTDEELAETWTLWQQRHLDAVRRAVEALQAGGALREGLDSDEAVDILYALTSTDVFRSLAGERGWSPERYEQWLFRSACAELLGVPAGAVPSMEDAAKPS